MKTLTTILCATAAALTVATAQMVSETTTTVAPVQAAGTVTTFDTSGNSIVISGPDAATPATYTYSKQTTIVDEAGNPVAVETVKSGMPVTVYYTDNGGQMVASKVVVRQAPVQQTTTTTTTTE